MAQLLTWLFIVTVGTWGATLVTCNFILMATNRERPRWYIAMMRKIGRRIGLEM
jgi:hypothetical protein